MLRKIQEICSTFFTKLSIRQKLVCIILGVSTVAVMLSEIIIATHEVNFFKEHLRYDGLMQSRMLAAHATASLAFDICMIRLLLLSLFLSI